MSHAYSKAAVTVSTSVAVALTNPIELNVVTNSAGNNVMKKPCTTPPIIAPRIPPVKLPNIPAVPPRRKL